MAKQDCLKYFLTEKISRQIHKFVVTSVYVCVYVFTVLIKSSEYTFLSYRSSIFR